jgi:hypothetical protein
MDWNGYATGGGKVAMLAGSHADLFTGISIVHPAMLDVKDVDGLAVPLALYPSKVRPTCLPSFAIAH